mmetsp:Transcript_109723/g.283568  ORF Transcript_109723/g.283568 Transcript_109723/m.283568 type:complete len:203 (-) Transcript_109723:226-834(-)
MGTIGRSCEDTAWLAALDHNRQAAPLRWPPSTSRRRMALPGVSASAIANADRIRACLCSLRRGCQRCLDEPACRPCFQEHARDRCSLPRRRRLLASSGRGPCTAGVGPPTLPRIRWCGKPSCHRGRWGGAPPASCRRYTRIAPSTGWRQRAGVPVGLRAPGGPDHTLGVAPDGYQRPFEARVDLICMKVFPPGSIARRRHRP